LVEASHEAYSKYVSGEATPQLFIYQKYKMVKHGLDKAILDILLKKTNSLTDPFTNFLSPAFEALDHKTQELIVQELILYLNDFYEFSEKERIDFYYIKNKIQKLKKIQNIHIEILRKLESLIENKLIFDCLTTHLKI
jgi:hypothetical protein